MTAERDVERRPPGGGARGSAVHRPAAALAPLVGNRTMATLLQRAPVATKGKTLPITSFAPTREEIEAAEAWLQYLAQRGRSAEPTLPFPERYRSSLESFRDAVAGAQDAGKVKPVADSRFLIRTLRELHGQLIGKGGEQVFALAELALKRGAANAAHEGGEAAFDVTGASELDVARTIMVIQSRAEEELAGAKEMGYRIPEELSRIPGQAGTRFEAARGTWQRGAPSGDRLVTPTEEADLVAWRDAALGAIGSMHARRAADLARYQQAEADAIQAAADKQMVELRAVLADRRRGLFMAGKTGELKKLHEASGQVVGVINEMKATAAIITKRVDQLNAVAQAVSSSGSKVINLPELPKGLTDAAAKLKGAHEKLGKLLELLDVLGPAKTSMDEGLKYLKGIDMALDHFSGKVGNPIFAIYVNSYLRPALQNCMAQLGKIANIISSQNRAAIGAGHPEYVMNWNVEPGGEGAYLFLAQVFKVGGAASINDEAWSYFRDNDDDLEAAVGEAMPSQRRAVGAWASRNRYALWEAFYGSTQAPR